MKIKIRKISAALAALTIMCAAAPLQPVSEALHNAEIIADAAAVISSGKCGENLTWTLDSDGTFTIEGSGEMKDTVSLPEWFDFREKIKKVVLPDGLTHIGKMAFIACANLTSVTIPSTVKSIGNGAFQSCGLQYVTIPNGVTSIGESAFAFCTDLSTVSVASSVTQIGAEAFRGTVWLKNKQKENPLVVVNNILIDANGCKGKITIPSDVKSIPTGVFVNNSALTDITADKDNAYFSDIDGVLFDKKQTTLIQYPVGKTLTEYTVPNTVTSISDKAFWSIDGLTTLNIPASVKNFKGAFNYCNTLKTVNFSKGITAISDYAFNECIALASIDIPEGVTSIGEYAFSSSINLADVKIPSTVTSIGNGAFDSCIALKTVNYAGSESDWKKVEIGKGNDYLLKAKIVCASENVTTTTKPVTTTPKATTTTTTKTSATTPKATTTTTSKTTTAPISKDTFYGDANCDSKIDISDVISVKCYLLNSTKYSLSKQGLVNADVQSVGNGLNSNDAVAIQQYSLKLIDKLPVD